MRIDEKDWDLLNAYADQELGEREASELRRRIADEPPLARELERIQSLKAALAETNPRTTTRGRAAALSSFSMRTALLAASLALAVGLSAGLASWFRTDAAPASVARLHETFSAKTYVVDHNRRVSVSGGVRFDAVAAPDLSDSNLTLVDVVEIDAPGGMALHYRGRRGCRLTMVVGETGPEDLTGDGSGSLVHAWRTASHEFVLIADGMDVARFDAIAAFAESDTRRRDNREALRTAMAERTERALPCA